MHEVTYREAVQEALIEEMDRDPTVFMLGENLRLRGGVYQVSKGLAERFEENRIMDMPISESAFVGAAVGAALLGTRPIVDLMFADFFPLAMDQLVNHAAKMRYMHGGAASVPLVIRAFFGAGTSLGSSHSQSLEAWFVHCPGLKVVMPSTPADVKGLLKTSIRDNDPVIFLEHRLLYAMKEMIPDDEYTIPLGVADVKREGNDLTIVATALMLHKALEAAAALEQEGIDVEVIDPRSLLPMDWDTILLSVQKTGRLLIAHEACKTGGVGAEIAAMTADKAFGYLDAPIVRVCAPDVPVPFSPPLEQSYIPKKEDIIKAAREIVA
jgi:pyruvate dehydrogenase E1 component beta subunit